MFEDDVDETKSPAVEVSELHEREATSIFTRKKPSKAFSEAVSSRLGSPSQTSGKRSNNFSSRALSVSRKPMGFSIEEITQESSDDQKDKKAMHQTTTQTINPDLTLINDTQETKIELLTVD